LKDIECWNIDDMSLYHYGVTYNNLNPLSQKLAKDSIDVTFGNIMSYHDSGNGILVDRQINRWLNSINDYTTRAAVSDGTHLYLATSIGGCATCPIGSYNNSYTDFNAAITQMKFISQFTVNPVMVIQPGTYIKNTGTLLIDEPMFITADKRDGDLIFPREAVIK